jgi:glycerol-3-phosphate dehydrogenase (NAD(P)+)
MSGVSVGIVGAGAWGTALANAVARAGRPVTLWARDADAVAAMTRAGENKARLPGVALAPGVMPTASLSAVAGADILLVVLPTQALRGVCEALSLVARPGTPVVACAKGIERGTGYFVTEIIAETMPAARPAILSGPSFAADVARGLPTAVTLAAADSALAATLAGSLGAGAFRLYHSTDVRGVEIGGAAKNVLAIAAGIVAGRRLGASASAALTARGFAELTRFGRAFGARPETLVGLSGLGDLILTCSGPQSRNFALGLALGEGIDAAAIAAGGKLAEGAFTAQVMVEMAAARGIDMPVSASVDAVLAGRMSVDQAIETLLARPQKAE